jgi:glycolate oxidase FAD binding subunit
MTSLRVHTGPVLTELRAACGGPHAAPGTAADAIGGVVPDYVAAPASTAQAAAVIRVAAARGLPVVVRGGGTKQGWGAPPRALGLVLDTGRMTAIL